MKYMGHSPRVQKEPLPEGLYFVKVQRFDQEKYVLCEGSYDANKKKMVWDRVADKSSHGTIVLLTSGWNVGIWRATTCFSKYNQGRVSSQYFDDFEKAVDYVVTNYLTHCYPNEDEGTIEFRIHKGSRYFCFIRDDKYYSGHIKTNGRAYIKDSYGRTVVSGANVGVEVDPKNFTDFVRTVFRMKGISYE